MKELNDNKQMKDVWTTSLTKSSEKKCGKHPTQKPLEILDKIILASTDENDLVLFFENVFPPSNEYASVANPFVAVALIVSVTLFLVQFSVLFVTFISIL